MPGLPACVSITYLIKIYVSAGYYGGGIYNGYYSGRGRDIRLTLWLSFLNCN